MRRLARYSLLAAVLALPLGVAQAQCGGNPKPTLTITPSDLALNPGVAEFNAGAIQSSYTVTITPKANKGWFLCLSWDGISSWTVPGYSKPVGDFQWSLDGSSWNSLTAADVAVASGSSATTFPIYVRVVLDETQDIPGPAPTGSYGTLIINFSAGS